MLTEGKYRAKAIAGRFGKSSQKQTPGVAVDLEILDGEHEGEVITWVGWLSPLAHEYTCKNLITLGYDEATSPEAENGQLYEKHFFSKEVQIVVEMEASQKNPDKFYPKVKWINELGGPGGGLDVLPKQELKLDFDLKSALAKARAELGVPHQNVLPKEETEDDIPF